MVLGAHNPQSNEDTQVVLIGSKVTVHEGYDEADNVRNDIAIIELPQEVEFNGRSIILIFLKIFFNVMYDFVF